MLGIALLWKSPSRGINIDVDLSVTLLNRESFTENQHFEISSANFCMSHGENNAANSSTVNGNRAFISIADLLSHRPRFVDVNGEFQIEIRLSNIRTCFTNEFVIQSKLINSDGCQDRKNGGSFDYESMEVRSETFGYGGFAWEIIVSPQSQLLTNSWASNTSSPKSTNRKALQQFSHGSEDKNTELENLGFQVALMRKAAKTVNLTNYDINSTDSFKNKSVKFPHLNGNHNNNAMGDNKKHENDNNNTIDMGPGHRSDELLCRLTYKVIEKC